MAGMIALPSETLMALIRAARLEGGAVPDAPAAAALAAIGASAAETTHLLALLRADNGGRFEAEALRRHAQMGAETLARAIDAIEDRSATWYAPMQALGGAGALAGLVGLFGATVATGGAAALLAGGAAVMGVGFARRDAANREKHRLRGERAALAFVARELEKLA